MKNCEFTFIETNQDKIEIKYIGLKYSSDTSDNNNNNNNIKFDQFTKYVHLSSYDKNTYNLKEDIAKFMYNNIFKIDMVPDIDKSQFDTIDELKKHINYRINVISKYIATNGRLGLANTIVSNSKMKKKYQHDTLNTGLNWITNKFIKDDDFFIIRKNKTSEPGFIIFNNKYDNKNAISSLGFYPEKYAVRLSLK